MLGHLNGYILFPILEKITKRDILTKYRKLKRFELLPHDKKLELNKKYLVEILEYSQSTIPYYKELFQKYNFQPEKCYRDIKYLHELPILNKEIVRERIKDLKVKSAGHKRKTGGSTGQSVFFFYDNEGLDWSAAINLMSYHMAGNEAHKRDAHISSSIGVEPKTFKSKFIDFMKMSSQNRRRIMINSFSDEDLGQTFEALKLWKPYLLQGHPSTAFAIAEYIRRFGHEGITYCNVFEPSGEMLTEKMVETIERYLKCKVVNRYGNAEFGVMAHSKYEDSFNRLKVFDRCFYVEECEESNLIVTGFTNTGMPLLRYDTGDMATVKNEIDGTYIYDIRGRIHDQVDIAGESYATHYIMDYIDHKIKNVREFQIIIKDRIAPILKIVLENDNDKKRINEQLKQRWPEGLYIEFISFSDLETVGWRQKFRHVIDKRQNV
jgi:phenylacetate-CoA ligase